MARKCTQGILKEILNYTSKTELPSIFSLWCGLSAISAALGRDVFIDMGHYTIFPNIYVVLVAGSGKCRKSATISAVAEKFINAIEPPINMLSQKATPEHLIGVMAGFREKEGDVIQGSAEGIIIADELSTLITRNSFESGLAQFLTTLWDSKDKFSYGTKARGKETIMNSCVSLLGGTTIDWIKHSIPMSSIGGGFTARILFVYQDAYEKLILRTKTTEENRKRADNIIHDLNCVTRMRGEMGINEESWRAFEAEYELFMKNSPLHNNKYLSGYANKRQTHLFKIVMATSAAYRDSRIVTLKDIAQGINFLNYIEQFMPKVLREIATDDEGMLMSDLFEIIAGQKSISRKRLLTIVHHKMHAAKMDLLLDTLEQAGKISMKIGKGDQIITLISEENETRFKSFTERMLEKD